MEQFNNNTDGTKGLLVTLGLAAGIVFVVWALQGQFSRRVAEHWREKLESADVDQTERLARRIAQNGVSGIPSLVDALGSQRSSVASAAKRVLSEQIDQWQLFDEYDADENLNVLAESLSDAMGQFGPSAQADATDLASRIILLPHHGNPEAHQRRIVFCEEVLQRLRPNTQQPGETRLLEPRAASLLGQSKVQPAVHTEQALTRTERDSTLDFKGSLKQVETHDPSTERHVSTRQPEEIPTENARSEVVQVAELDSASEAIETNEHLSANWAIMETRDLMRQLRSDVLAHRTAAGEELLQRGFRQVHLEMARRLFDPDPEARKRLARLLPDLQSIDPMPWLLRLAEDEDVEVRRLAIGLLATTNDPQVLDQLERIIERDSDPTIRIQGERIAQRRREANVMK